MSGAGYGMTQEEVDAEHAHESRQYTRINELVAEALSVAHALWPTSYAYDYVKARLAVAAEEKFPERETKPGPKRAWILPEVRWAVFERDDFRCQGCGSRRFLEVDHVIPLSQGGMDELPNMQTLCRGCNRGKGTK